MTINWIGEGETDPAKFSIDPILRQTLSADDRAFRSGLSFLATMYDHGRKEAGIFLLGLLVSSEDNWEKRSAIVEAVSLIETKPCVDLLFAELKRVKSTPATRRYLNTLLQVLGKMPFEMIQAGFEGLACDKTFSPKFRAKFQAILQEKAFQEDDDF